MSIAPGVNVCIEIIERPRSQSALKTLVRICRKDPRVAAFHRRQSAKRPSHQQWRRGGNYWNHRMKTEAAVAVKPGQKYNVLASLDVVRDLKSIEKCVKVTPA